MTSTSSERSHDLAKLCSRTLASPRGALFIYPIATSQFEFAHWQWQQNTRLQQVFPRVHNLDQFYFSLSLTIFPQQLAREQTFMRITPSLDNFCFRRTSRKASSHCKHQSQPQNNGLRNGTVGLDMQRQPFWQLVSWQRTAWS